jgi:hypothetical protein
MRPLTPERRAIAVVAAACALLYASTLYPGVGGRINYGDSAKFQFLGVVLGVSHPPGNPLYLLLAAVFSHLPFVAPSLGVKLLSAVSASVAVAFVFATNRLFFGTLSSLVGAALLALGPTFWIFATEAEVYTLNAAIVAGSLFHLLRWRRDRDTRDLLIGGCVSILGFGNHLTIVCLGPTVLLLLAHDHKWVEPTPKRLGVIAATLLATVALYAYVPLRSRASAYSEFAPQLGSSSLWDYVTAKKYQANFKAFDAVEALNVRLPGILATVQKQWVGPLLMGAAAGAGAMLSVAPGATALLVLSTVSYCTFAFAYGIPDGEGFFIPIYVCGSIFAAALVDLLSRQSKARGWAVAALMIALLVPPARIHLRELSTTFSRTEVDEMGDGHGLIAWDLPEVVRLIPEGATLMIPCAHYGCVETMNYVRFADSNVARRRVSFARFPWTPYSWSVPAPPVVNVDEARRTVMCVIHANDSARMSALGIKVDRIDRPERIVAGKRYPGVPIFCSHPGT